MILARNFHQLVSPAFLIFWLLKMAGCRLPFIAPVVFHLSFSLEPPSPVILAWISHHNITVQSSIESSAQPSYIRDLCTTIITNTFQLLFQQSHRREFQRASTLQELSPSLLQLGCGQTFLRHRRDRDGAEAAGLPQDSSLTSHQTSVNLPVAMAGSLSSAGVDITRAIPITALPAQGSTSGSQIRQGHGYSSMQSIMTTAGIDSNCNDNGNDNGNGSGNSNTSTSPSLSRHSFCSSVTNSNANAEGTGDVTGTPQTNLLSSPFPQDPAFSSPPAPSDRASRKRKRTQQYDTWHQELRSQQHALQLQFRRIKATIDEKNDWADGEERRAEAIGKRHAEIEVTTKAEEKRSNEKKRWVEDMENIRAKIGEAGQDLVVCNHTCRHETQPQPDDSPRSRGMIPSPSRMMPGEREEGKACCRFAGYIAAAKEEAVAAERSAAAQKPKLADLAFQRLGHFKHAQALRAEVKRLVRDMSEIEDEQKELEAEVRTAT